MAWIWLSAGIDPQKTIIFVQSHGTPVTELHTILSMVTPLGKLTDLQPSRQSPRKSEECKLRSCRVPGTDAGR
jgi:tryptophanyl-tRNA synthetase